MTTELSGLIEYLRWYAKDVAARSDSDIDHPKFIEAADMLERLSPTEAAEPRVERVIRAVATTHSRSPILSHDEAKAAIRTALASSGNAPGDDKGLVERVAALVDPTSFQLRTELAKRESIGFPDLGKAQDLADERWTTALEKAEQIVRLTTLSSGNEVAKVVEWQPIETAPKDAPILAWCASTCDDPKCAFSGSEEDCKAPDGSYALCLFHGHAEGLCACSPGLQIVQWGGGWSDGYEDGGGYMPDWWFRVGSEFEESANPTHWMPLPSPPASDTAPLTGG